jgi:hypothetical protein
MRTGSQASERGCGKGVQEVVGVLKLRDPARSLMSPGRMAPERTDRHRRSSRPLLLPCLPFISPLPCSLHLLPSASGLSLRAKSLCRLSCRLLGAQHANSGGHRGFQHVELASERLPVTEAPVSFACETCLDFNPLPDPFAFL